MQRSHVVTVSHTRRLRVSKSVPPSEVNPRASVFILFTSPCDYPDTLYPQAQLSPARSSLHTQGEKKKLRYGPVDGN